jgi:hypothetical protein
MMMFLEHCLSLNGIKKEDNTGEISFEIIDKIDK